MVSKLKSCKYLGNDISTVNMKLLILHAPYDLNVELIVCSVTFRIGIVISYLCYLNPTV